MREDTEDAGPDLDIDLDLDTEDSGDGDPAGVGPGAAPGTGAAGRAQAEQRPDTDRPASGAARVQPLPQRLSGALGTFADWLRRFGVWLRRKTPLAPSYCVVLGPSASGKTALLMSLDHCEQAQSHSFLQYSVTITNPNAHFAQYRHQLGLNLPKGSLVLTSKLEDCLQPAFTLCLGEREGRLSQRRSGLPPLLMRFGFIWRRETRMRFSTFDGAGGLVVGDSSPSVSSGAASVTRGERICRELLEQSLRSCDAVLLCLPVDPDAGGYYRQQEMALKDIIHQLAENENIGNLVLCFTMYEKLGARMGRHAYATLTQREAARNAMRNALEQSKRILRAIERFRRSQPRRAVWCVPVSSFGFVPGNGGANLSEVIQSDGDLGDVLRTRYAEPEEWDLHRPYTEREVWDVLWQPFATLDPFIFIATGFKDHRNTLIHSYHELWR